MDLRGNRVNIRIPMPMPRPTSLLVASRMAKTFKFQRPEGVDEFATVQKFKIDRVQSSLWKKLLMLSVRVRKTNSEKYMFPDRETFGSGESVRYERTVRIGRAVCKDCELCSRKR